MSEKKDVIIRALRLAIGIIVVIFGVLQVFGVWNRANFVAIPLLGVMLLLQAVSEWNRSRGAAIFSVIASAFVFACSFAVFII